MADTYVSFSKENCVDSFTAFGSFQEPKDPIKIDQSDIDELKESVLTNPTGKTKKSKRNSSMSNSTKATSATPTVQCDICSVPISGPIVFDSHNKGKKHQIQLKTVLSKNPDYKMPTYEELCLKKQEPAVVNDESEKSNVSVSESDSNEKQINLTLISPKKLNCHMCNISCNSQQMFDNHITGKKHQAKLKLNNSNNSAPVQNRTVPDNNPSSSNYCDVCLMQLNSENELTEHLNQKQHQAKVKEAEYCAKAGAELNINFEDYKIPMVDREKDGFEYQCTKCMKKFRNKTQLIDHLKSPAHNRQSNGTNNQNIPKPSTREKSQPRREVTTRHDTVIRNKSSGSFRTSTRPPLQPRQFRSQHFSRNRTYPPYDANPNQSTSQNIFGAFDPNNQATYPPTTDNNNYYPSSTKRPTSYEAHLSEYDGFFPKRTRPYKDESDISQDYYSTDRNYYASSSTSSNYPWNTDNSYQPQIPDDSYPPQIPDDSYPPQIPDDSYPPQIPDSDYPPQIPDNSYPPQINEYHNQSSITTQPPWSYPTEPHYDQQAYVTPTSTYTDPIHYPSNQPPLPTYEQPPLPTYPHPSSYSRPQNTAFHGSTRNHGINNFYSNTYGQ